MARGDVEEEERRRERERGFWDRLAPRYDTWVASAFDEQYQAFRRVMLERVEEGDEVLEVGTGTGDIAIHIAPKAGRVTGVDLAPRMIEVARGKAAKGVDGEVDFQVADAYSLPFEEGSFDKLVCVNALQTMKEPERAIAEGRRVLRPGGEFVSITYCFGTSGAWEVLKLAKWVLRYGLPRYWSNFKCTQVRAMFERAGLVVEECQGIWKRPAVVLLRGRKASP